MENTLKVSAELLQRYSVQGPRYTSYPTALQFREDLDKNHYRDSLATIASDGDAVSLYVHLPFCRKLCLYCACNVVISQSQSIARSYLDDLNRELDLIQGAMAGVELEVEQLHLGGGTPSFLSAMELCRLYELLEQRFTFSKSGERAIEIDPRVTSKEQLEALRDLGFNRVSFGVQDLDERVQAAINRHQSREQTLTLYKLARSMGFQGINIDLIYGLPEQNLDSFDETLNAIIDLAPDRIACFGYAHVPWLRKAQRALEKYKLPDANLRFQLFARAIEKFTAANYQFIGLDHFARHDDEIALAQREGRLKRNFQGYTTYKARSIVALGVSAITDLASENGVYVQNFKDLTLYKKALEQGQLPIERGYKLSADDALRRDVIMTLMCGNLNWQSLSTRHPNAQSSYFVEEYKRLEEYQVSGFLHLSDQGIQITELGRFFIRNICMVFDKHLSSHAHRYSNTI
jgi:oxygen-independent coproporphyrinogen III oxidase